MGTHMRVLMESYPMNTNMTGFRWFSKKSLHHRPLDKSSLSIGRVKGTQSEQMLLLIQSAGAAYSSSA